MNEAVLVQGRRVTPQEVARIRELLRTNPDWSRRHLSNVLAAEWDWRNGAGRLKDMATRTLLLKLEARELIRLPPRRQTPSNRMTDRCLPQQDWDSTPVTGRLSDLGPLSIREVARRLGTSASQLYRLLDPADDSKSLRQVIALLHVLGCRVDLAIKSGTARKAAG